jgi:hypothetical protein
VTAVGAEGADEVAALVRNGGLNDTATATAVYDAMYAPYALRQAQQVWAPC